MKDADIVTTTISRLPTDSIFTDNNFDAEVENQNAVVKTLTISEQTGFISKQSKGKYDKPRKTEFGALKPVPYQLIKDLLVQDGKQIGYLTGYSVYNDLGLTTHVANALQIGTNSYRRAIKRGLYTISFIGQPNKIAPKNIELLRILDAVRFIKNIPATTPDEACLRLKFIFKELSLEKRVLLISLVLKYSDYVRALCGAILEEIGENEALLNILQKSLKSVTTYNVQISDNVLSTQKNWRLK